MKATRSARWVGGFTMIELIVVVLAVVGLGALLLPALAKTKSSGGRIKCVNNLKQVGLAFKVFAGDNSDTYPFATTNSLAYTNDSAAWLHFQSMSNELQTAKVLLCPSDTRRRNEQAENFQWGSATNRLSLAALENGAVSYFIGLDATENLPLAVQSGDRNLDTNRMSMRGKVATTSRRQPPVWSKEIHSEAGNVLLADGAVWQWTNDDFASYLRTNSMPSSRLLLPIVE